MQFDHFLNLEYFFRAIIDLVTNFHFTAIINFLLALLAFLRPISLWISAILLFGIIYSIMRARQVRREQKIELAEHVVRAAERRAKTVGQTTNPKWDRVLEHLRSENQSDWRLSIMEADIMLEELLNALGHHGESIGEKLKAVEPSDFTNLDAVWEAHKVRNAIAHEGGDFTLTQREAKRVINLYRLAFEEFKFIPHGHIE
jgi:hypothetical protein